MSIIIADASPLIALVKIERLELLQKLYQQVWIPEAVKNELHLDSDMPGARRLKQAMESGWLQCKKQEYPQQAYRQLSLILDTGEVEAILLAESQKQRQGYRFLLIDERKGRKIAQNKGLVIAGSGTVLLAAKRKGYLDSVKNELEAMQNCGYRISDALKQRILELAEE